jgi:predicted site-specific integrase-resolvase
LVLSYYMTDSALRIKSICAQTDSCPATVRQYAAAGLIPAVRDSNGNWVFPPEAIEAVRRLRAARQPRPRESQIAG